MANLKDKKVLITGASAGLGAALALGFAEQGATVGICARRADRLAEVLARLQVLSPDSQAWTVDLNDLDGIAAFAAEVENQFGGVDILINNAGIPKRRDVTRLTAEESEAVMRINYFSPVRLILALLPSIIERQGHVVNISSVAARLGPPIESAYSASKAAITAFSECMAVDLRHTGVGVHIVNPGLFETELFDLPNNETGFHDPKLFLPVEDIVAPVLAMLDSGSIECYVPDWFGNVVTNKFSDPDVFIANSKNYADEVEANRK